VKKKVIKKNAIFLHHTGNMYGIGCSVFSENAIDKIKKLKQRENKKGFIALLPDISWLEKFNIEISKKMNRLLQQFWPGELTVILSDPQNIFKNVSVNKQVAFRVPTDKFLRDSIKRSGFPIISTSVNNKGEAPETDLKKIRSRNKLWFDLEILPKKILKNDQQPSTIIQEESGKLILIREGKIGFSEIKRSWQTPRILFVCTANICRSPMAHYYLQKLLVENDLDFEVRSAGFLQSNIGISQNSYETLNENEINAAKHVSTQLTDDVVLKSWLILTMTKNHKFNLLEFFPNSEGKVFTLSEYTGFQQDIDDPYGLEIFHYRQTFKKIKKRIDSLFEKLQMEVM